MKRSPVSQGERHAFSSLGYQEFRRTTGDAVASLPRKTGLPDSEREGHEAAIYLDIRSKLTNLRRESAVVMNVGPGWAGLPPLLLEHCACMGQQLLLVNSPEMLDPLPDAHNVIKLPGAYPDGLEQLSPWRGRLDAIVCYGMFHDVFAEAHGARFLDRFIELLAPGGQMLIGDIPNASKRKRLLASDVGVRHHQDFLSTDARPQVDLRAVEHDQIDDATLMALIMRARAKGCDAYWLHQAPHLPMSNRREDILICKP